MKKFILFYFIALNFAFSFSKKVETPKPSEGQSSSSSSVIAKVDIEALAANSACAKVVWKDRGAAPKAYIKGMAQVFFENACNKGSLVDAAISAPLGSSSKDALKYYGLASNRVAVFTLLTGLGMRESSGKHCEGRDGSANNVTASTAEAGLFQTSYSSVGASSVLKALFQKYTEGQGACYLDTFKQGVSCSSKDAVNYGAGNGRLFQELSKTCPAFAVYYGAVMLRVLRQHYGPLNRKEAQYKKECEKMYSEIEALATPSNCGV